MNEKENKLTLALMEAVDCKNPNTIKYHLTQVLTAFEEMVGGLPQGHTPDGKNHWVSVKDIDGLLSLLHEARCQAELKKDWVLSVDWTKARAALEKVKQSKGK